MSSAREIRRIVERYGSGAELPHKALERAKKDGEPILGLYDIGRDPVGARNTASKVRPQRPTEWLFLERSVDLLRPGGRLGIVLPDGILNNPSLAWLREYIESRAKIVAVVSIPQEVFASSDATVKTSLVFLRRFTQAEEADYAAALAVATVESDEWAEGQLNALEEEVRLRVDGSDLSEVYGALIEARTLREDGQRAEGRAVLRKLTDGCTPEELTSARALLDEVDQGREQIARARAQMVRARTREQFDYPVFLAEAHSAGITATGLTGPSVPNELPSVLAEFRRYEADPVTYEAEALAELEKELAELDPELELEDEAGSVQVPPSSDPVS